MSIKIRLFIFLNLIFFFKKLLFAIELSISKFFVLTKLIFLFDKFKFEIIFLIFTPIFLFFFFNFINYKILLIFKKKKN